MELRNISNIEFIVVTEYNDKSHKHFSVPMEKEEAIKLKGRLSIALDKEFAPDIRRIHVVKRVKTLKETIVD